MSTNKVVKIGYRDSGSVGARTEITANLLVSPSQTNNRDQFTAADKNTYERGHRQTYVFEGADWSDFAALETAMRSGVEQDVLVTFLGTSHELGLDPVTVKVSPVLNSTSDIAEFYTGTASATGNPGSGTGWTSHGGLLGTSQPTIEAQGDEDNLGRFCYSFAQLEHSFILKDTTQFAALETIEGAGVMKAAFRRPSGDYQLYDNVHLSVTYDPRFGSTLQGLPVRIAGSAEQISDLLTLTAANPAIYYTRFRLELSGAGYAL